MPLFKDKMLKASKQLVEGGVTPTNITVTTSEYSCGCLLVKTSMGEYLIDCENPVDIVMQEVDNIIKGMVIH